MSRIVLYWGDYLGCGKSAAMTRKAKQAHDKGISVYSNYYLSFVEKENIQAAERLLLDREITDSFMAIDELSVIMDSRQSAAGDNQFMTDTVLMVRKNHNQLHGTSQQPGFVDLRYRDLADYHVYCRRTGMDMDPKAIIRLMYYKNTVEGFKYKPDMFVVQEVMDLYDTDECIDRDRIAYVNSMIDYIVKNKYVMDRLKKFSKKQEQKAVLAGYMSLRGSKAELILMEMQYQSLL